MNIETRYILVLYYTCYMHDIQQQDDPSDNFLYVIQ